MTPGQIELTTVSDDRAHAEEHPTDMDGAVFLEMFGGLFKRRKEEAAHNLAGECHLGGGMERDQRGSLDSHKQSQGDHKLGNICSSSGRQHQKREKNSNNDNALGVHSIHIGNPSDQRVYANYEAAGLPKKELKRLVRVLHNSVIAGQRRVTMSLKLPEIGEIRFDVRIIGKKVFINAAVETTKAATAMALAISDLKTLLEECGLELGRFDVTTDDDSDTKKGKERRNSGESSFCRTGSPGREPIGGDPPRDLEEGRSLIALA